MKKSLLSLAVAGLVSASLPASAIGTFEEFTVNEFAVPGATVVGAAQVLVVDKLNGNYKEVLTVTSPLSFSAQAFANFTAYLANDGTTAVTSLLNNLNAFGGYRMYAVFSAVGAITGVNSFSSTSNEFTLWLDPDSDTTATLSDGLTAPVLFNTADDLKLGFAGPGLSSGTGNLNGPPGAFNIDWYGFTLDAPTGNLFFSLPSPFYTHVRVNGDYDIVTDLDPFTKLITGDVSAVFPIPEPGSLVLMGLSLVGLNIAARRKRAT